MGSHRAVLMVDRDLATLFVLADQLHQRGVTLIPSASVKQVRSLASKIQPTIEVLVVNCGVSGVCGLAREMARQYPAVEVIGIVSGNHQCSSCREMLTFCVHDTEVRDARWVSRMAHLLWSRMGKHQSPSTTIGGHQDLKRH